MNICFITSETFRGKREATSANLSVLLGIIKAEVDSGVDREKLLNVVCEKLLKCDPDIVEIIQFGSSVYAPDLSRDVDLLVISSDPKDYDVYLDAVDEANPLFNVDVVVVKLGQELA